MTKDLHGYLEYSAIAKKDYGEIRQKQSMVVRENIIRLRTWSRKLAERGQEMSGSPEDTMQKYPNVIWNLHFTLGAILSIIFVLRSIQGENAVIWGVVNDMKMG